MIRPIRESDVPACVDIYNHYICNTTYSFETEALTCDSFLERVKRISADYPYLVYEDEESGLILGYAYLDRFSERGAYRFTCDLSIYVSSDVLGQEIGYRLYDAIEKQGIACGFYNIIAIVTSENERSMRFHERQGFVCAAQFDDVAFKHGRWLGVRYYRKTVRQAVGVPKEPCLQNLTGGE